MKILFFRQKTSKIKKKLKFYCNFSIYLLFLIINIFYPNILLTGPVSNKEVIISTKEEFSDSLNKIINLYGISQGGRAKKVIQNHSKDNINILESSPVDIIISRDIKFLNMLESQGLIKKNKVIPCIKNDLLPLNTDNKYYISVMVNAPNPYEASVFFSFIKAQ